MKRLFSSGWTMVAVLCVAVTVLIYLRLTDPDDQFIDRGVQGPFSYARIEADNLVVGPRVEWVSPGAEFGLVSTFCPGATLAYVALVRLVRDADGLIVETRRRQYEAGERRCGPAAATTRVPANAVPGAYRLEREAVLITRGRPNRTVVLEPLLFTVRGTE